MTLSADVTKRLKAAWSAVDSADLPEHIQATALTLAYSDLAGRPPIAPGESRENSAVGERSGEAGPNESGDNGGNSTNKEFLDLLARKADMSTNRLAQVLVLHEGEVELVPSERRLGPNSATRFRRVAELMVPALLVLSSASSVEASRIKQLGERYGARDQNRNFRKYVSDIRGYSFVGTGRNRAFTLTPGWEGTFAAAVSEILGESEP